MNRRTLTLAALVVLIGTGCRTTTPESPDTPPEPTYRVETGMLVQLAYTGTLPDGTQFAHAPETAPLTVIIGRGMLIPGLEEGIMGMVAGQERTVVVPPGKGYGSRHEKAVQTFSWDELPEMDRTTLRKGALIAVNTKQGIVPATVVSVSDEGLTLDFNHPLAGKTLIFNVHILTVRPPSPEEERILTPFTIQTP
ncbi:FKBP-type peptidyl-prolyl cis-trans isomerase [Spirochaeta thermophila]|uniref:Peptidyl-prolyl cis-trans isomerase n=1 Tax=Winmispira thermophila (strain ATCC 49972 / DSM 6192 / RI 19.B1) TaxID=665571 RepID=E0RNY9_WINT6|nr:peptidylprolyl isomerase [Spirochaeta thermophila]ADN02651.1 predicted FKBP-type peptidyl-prolyl cis-trans isomerase [Spirochaeta thermophila DSM 6192]